MRVGPGRPAAATVPSPWDPTRVGAGYNLQSGIHMSKSAHYKMPDIVVVTDRQSHDLTCPVKKPVWVRGWGYTTRGITYNVPGWNQFPDIEYYIVESTDGYHIVDARETIAYYIGKGGGRR